MEAGEVVYQGREGTGGAQVFPMQHRSLGDWVAGQVRQRQNLEIQNRRYQHDMMKYRDSQIKDWENTKFDKPSPFYGEAIQKSMSEYLNHGNDLLNQGHDKADVRTATAPLRDVIDRQIKRSQNADNLYRMGKADLATQKNKDVAWTEQHLRNKLYSPDQNVDNADFDAAQNALNHPRATDFSKSVKLAADDIKNQVQMAAADPSIKDSGLGKYMIIDKGRARFGYTDKSGKMVPGINDDLIQHVVDKFGDGENNELGKSIKWQMAKEATEKSLGRPVDEHIDEPAIMNNYKAITNPNLDPSIRTGIQTEFKNRLRNKVKGELTQLQQQSDETVVHGLGQYPSSWTNPNTPKAEDYAIRDQQITDLQNPFSNAGELTPETEATLGTLVGAKLGGKTIVTAPIPIKAGENSGATDSDGEPVQDAKDYDRYVVNVASGTGLNEVIEQQEIPLNQDNYGLFHTILNTSGAHKKIEFDKAMKAKKDRDAKNRPAKEAEIANKLKNLFKK